MIPQPSEAGDGGSLPDGEADDLLSIRWPKVDQRKRDQAEAFRNQQVDEGDGRDPGDKVPRLIRSRLLETVAREKQEREVFERYQTILSDVMKRLSCPHLGYHAAALAGGSLGVEGFRDMNGLASLPPTTPLLVVEAATHGNSSSVYVLSEAEAVGIQTFAKIPRKRIEALSDEQFLDFTMLYPLFFAGRLAEQPKSGMPRLLLFTLQHLQGVVGGRQYPVYLESRRQEMEVYRAHRQTLKKLDESAASRTSSIKNFYEAARQTQGLSTEDTVLVDTHATPPTVLLLSREEREMIRAFHSLALTHLRDAATMCGDRALYVAWYDIFHQPSSELGYFGDSLPDLSGRTVYGGRRFTELFLT